MLSVVTVTFNPGTLLQRTVDSVVAQTARLSIEYLVVDGGSTDGTVPTLAALGIQGIVDKWISEPDTGIYDAMNKGTNLACGVYTLFLNAGDVFPDSATVENLLELGNARPGFVWGDSEVDRNGALVADPASRMLRFLYRQMTVCHQSLAVRTDLLRAHPFDLTLKVAADYAVLCALVAEGIEGLYRPIVVSRVQDQGFSSRNFSLGLDEKRRVSRQFFPGDQWRARPFFALWGLYVRWKFRLKAMKGSS